MAKPLVVPMTPGIVAADNYTIRLTAISPTDGSEVSGVVISSSVIIATNLSDIPLPQTQAGPFTLLPGT